jgi:hypothetical protein
VRKIALRARGEDIQSRELSNFSSPSLATNICVVPFVMLEYLRELFFFMFFKKFENFYFFILN